MSKEPQTGAADGESGRMSLMRDIVVLQFKLVVDGFRDLVLVPVSLLAGITSLIRGDTGPSNEFYELLRLGKRSERWINLFGAVEGNRAHDDESLPVNDMDEIVTKVETFLVEEYRSGGVTRQAKEKLDRAIDRLRENPGRADSRD